MNGGLFSRSYVMLRPFSGSAEGFARLENRGGRGCLTLRVSALPTGCACLRVLLLSGDAQSGAMLDLGLLRPNVQGCGSLRREGLPSLSAEGSAAYHSLVLCTDWPRAVILLHGALVPACVPPRWQLEEAVRHYLTVPSEADAAPAPLPTPLQGEPPEASPAPAARPEAAVPLTACSSETPEPPDPFVFEHLPQAEEPPSVLSLPEVVWPPCFADLQAYFEALPPIAPFDAPDWRYVKVPIPAREPAPWCAVGVKLDHCRVTQAAYALPGRPDRLPAGGLRGYRWQEGRSGQGYWVLVQHAPA